MERSELFGTAVWVGAPEAVTAPFFRSDFETRASIADAEITICGLGFFELYLNGKRVEEDYYVPVTSDYVKRNFLNEDGSPFEEEMGHRVYAVRYDVTGYLAEGLNKLAVHVGPGWFATPTWSFGDRHVAFGSPRLIYRLRVTYADGIEEAFVSGNNVKYRTSYVVTSDLFHGEKHDFTLADTENWKTEKITNDPARWKPVGFPEDLDTVYELQNCPPDRVARCVKPTLLRSFGDMRVYDAGANITGFPVMKLHGKKGDTVTVSFSEELNHYGAVNLQYNYRQCFEVICGDGEATACPVFTWYGFRYFSVVGPAEPEEVLVIHTDAASTAEFTCDDEVLNWLFDTYRETQLMNMHAGIPSDCPHIERRGYTGDGQLCARSGMLLLDTEAFYRKWMKDIMDCQDRKTGHVQYTAPYTRCGGGPGGWGCAIVTVPFEFYRAFGDASPMQEMYPQMLRYLDYLERHSEKGLVTSDRPGEWCLGDWCPPTSKVFIPEPFVNTYYHIRMLRLIRRIETILSIETVSALENGEDLNTREARITEAFLANYYDAESGDFCGNLQGANGFGVDLGLGDERTLAHLVEHYEATGQYDTGIIGTEIVTRILFEHGHAATAVKLLTSREEVSFHGMMKAGATSLHECWPGEFERSHNHPMFGAVTYVLSEYILGIRQAEGSAGYERICIEPMCPEQIRSASGSVKTARGEIRVSYTYEDGELKLSAEVPAGIEVI